MLFNLLKNAAKYGPEDSTITVKLTQDKREVTVRVTDHGPGILPKEMKNLFLPY